MKAFKLLLLSTTLMTSSYTNEHTSMDALLDTFRKNSDLSKKTRLENAGNVTIFTREELEQMQARNLRDIMKSLPMLNYVENRWGIPDTLYVPTHIAPFNSNAIRIYIDNQEVSTASYGSGLYYLGNIDLGFVDHIEIYTINPSFEYSTEPARYLIKLYSKVAKRDKGSKLKVSTGSRGFNQESYQYADVVDDVSYFTYASRMDDKRKEYKSFDTPLSRDAKRYFLFSTISTNEHKLQIQAIKNKRNMFLGASEDGRVEKAKNKTSYLHIGYENTSIDDLKLNITFESARSSILAVDTQDYIDVRNRDNTVTVEAQYKLSQNDKNSLMLGAKYRYKHFTLDKFRLDGYETSNIDYDTQVIASLYLEDHYTLNNNWLLSLGTQFSNVYNNSDIRKQNVWMARAGLIYSSEKWISKTFLHRSAFFIEPYLYALNPFNVQNNIKPEIVHNITHEVQYKNDSHTLKAVVGYERLKNYTLVKSATLKVVNKKEDTSIFFTDISYKYELNTQHHFSSSFSYSNYDNLASGATAKGFAEYKGLLRLTNSYDKFTVFNELIYNYSTLIKKNYFDYSAGVTYQYNDNLIFSLKGENILDKARRDLFRIGERNFETGKWISHKPLLVSPIDQKIYFTVEYLF